MPDDNESEIRVLYRTKVFTALNYLAEGLSIFAEQQLQKRFPKTWQDNIHNHASNLTDPHILLATIENRWNTAFASCFGAVPRRVVTELRHARNATSHGEAFSAEAVDNSISSMLQLLKNIPQSEASMRAADCIEKLRHQPIHTDNLAPVAEVVVNTAVEEYALTFQAQADTNLVKAEASVDDNTSDKPLSVGSEQPSKLPSDVPSISGSQNMPTVTYNFSRLCFKASQIEPLQDNQVFRVITPVGSSQMTKAEFHKAFPRVVVSKSYFENGIYHYPTVPKSALPYKLLE